MEASTSQQIGSLATSIPTFPGAGQPSIIRSHQKDEVYQLYLTESCQDAFRRLLGPRRALELDREIRLLADFLYYSFTTGRGNQTLGEEYCDILQASGVTGAPPSVIQRGFLVLLQSLGPYLTQKALTPVDDEFAAWRAARFQGQRPSLDSAAQDDVQANSHGAQLRQLVRHIQQAIQALKLKLYDSIQPVLQPMYDRWPNLQRFMTHHGGALLRFHLALFYSYGMYYQLSKRLSGVRYLFIGRLFEHRPSYKVLGMLLFLQLGVTTTVQLLKAYGHLSFGSSSRTGAGPAKHRHAPLLHPNGSEVTPEEERELLKPLHMPGISVGSSTGEVASALRCPLCLSQRVCPTATPCGHVFCWQCITEWCGQKPECPLCRAQVVPPALVCVRHADF